MDRADEIEAAFSLRGRVAVVTGAGSGLGQEAARIFATAGARVVASDISEAGLAATAGLIGESGGEALSRIADVSRRSEMDALADFAVAEAGALDIWLNCAGVSYLHSLLETDEAQAERTVSINMMGPYWGCVAAARAMRERGGGSIVNVSSGGGAKPLPGIAVYGMTKAAVNSLTWTAAAEFGPFGIRVNAVAPGWIETPMAQDLFRDETGAINPDLAEKVRQQMKDSSPLHILGKPSDIAFALLYLASDASRFVTGQVLAVNGGESM
jgi:3-oxoacyl-[acyl-carrier protein] reductase